MHLVFIVYYCAWCNFLTFFIWLAKVFAIVRAVQVIHWWVAIASSFCLLLREVVSKFLHDEKALFFIFQNYSSILGPIVGNQRRNRKQKTGNGNPIKTPYISGNGTLLYFRKLLIFQELKLEKKTKTFWQNLLYFG